MRIMRKTIFSITALMLASICLAEEQKVKLDFCTDKTAAQMDGPTAQADSSKGGIKVCGKEFRVDGKYQRGFCTVGIDSNGDGKISSKETVRFSTRNFKPFGVTFKVSVAGSERNVPIVIYQAWGTSNNGVVLNYRSAWAMSGKVGGQTVYFLNEPQDDGFTSRNAYYTSKSVYPAPLRTNICVGGKFYKASLKDDGSELTIEEISEKQGFCKFSFNVKMRGCQCLILADDTWSFDLLDPAIKSVPAGTFDVKSCVYGTKGAIFKTDLSDAVSMTFKDDSENIITFGAPFTYYFKATVTGDNVEVIPSSQVMGSGGEIYTFEGPTGRVPPTVLIYIGRKCASKGRMEFG